MSEVFEHGYAVVIGINDNKIKKLALPAVARDVQAVYDVLVHPQRCAYKKDNVRLLKDQDSTKDNILDALEWLKEKASGDPKATAVIYYSGHGWADKAKGDYYLIPYDVTTNLRRTALPAELLTDMVEDVKAPRMLALFDCCHAGGLGVKDIDPDTLEDAPEGEITSFPLDLQFKGVDDFTGEPGSKDVGQLEEGDGRAVLNSSTGAQKSYIPKGGKLSLFTQHLIESLTGYAPQPEDATTVWVSNIISWVRFQVRKSAREMGVEQTPVTRMTNDFPVAQLIGGEGVAKGLDGQLPDPTAPLSPEAVALQARDISDSIIAGGNVDVQEGGIRVGDGATFEGPVAGGNQDITDVTFDFEGQTVGGSQTNIGEIGGNVDHIGDVNYGDDIDAKVSGGSIAAIGRNARLDATVGSSPAVPPAATGDAKVDYDALFASLENSAAGKDAALVAKAGELKRQVARGSDADDYAVAGLIEDIQAVDAGMAIKLVFLFSRPEIAATSGPATQYVIKKLAD